MLLSIKADKNHNLLYHFVHDAEELVQEFKLGTSRQKIQALRKSLDSETEVVETLIDQAYPNNPCLVEYDEIDNGIRVVVFSNPPTPKLVQGIEGGIVQWTLADNPVEVLRLDLDIEGADKSELTRWTDIDGGKGKAYACLDTPGNGVDINPEYVEKVYNEVKPQMEKLHRVD